MLDSYRLLVAAVLRGLPLIMIDPNTAMLFWFVAFLVMVQYRRVAANEQKMWGSAKNNPLYQTVLSLIFGFIGGLVASFLMVMMGISLTNSGITYLWPVAMLLFLIAPRLLCFSYAGGLISLLYLITGFPKVYVPGIVCLVAILHITESILIALSGATCSTPVYLNHEQEGIVGGFGLQRFWPVPLMALLFVGGPEVAAPHDLIAMPDWWPLVSPYTGIAPNEGVYALFPVIAALGYSDVALSLTPAEKSRRSAASLAAYSLILLVLGVASAKIAPLQWAAALFGPIGHELVIMMGGKWELRKRPIFTADGKGLAVLDVLPGSPAQEAGLTQGDIIVNVNGLPVNDKTELVQALSQSTVADLYVVSPRKGISRHLIFRGQMRSAGIIFVPDPDDQSGWRIVREGPGLKVLRHWYRRLRNRK